jgi:hypothetical protein
MKSVFDAIQAATKATQTATEQTAVNTGMWTEIDYSHASWNIMREGATGPEIVQSIYIPYSEYQDNDYGRAQAEAAYRPQRFAEGGIASGPDSGYAATLHGTELVVSPLSSYPATVKGAGGDNVLIEEVRKLRAETADLKTHLYQITKNTGKMAKINDRWDSDGMPAERVL